MYYSSDDLEGRSVEIFTTGIVFKSHFQLSGVVFTGIISIQSVGHGATHKSHPVHSDSITVCKAFVPPTMASTGQA